MEDWEGVVVDTVGVGEWGTLTHKSFALSVAQLGHKGEPIVNQRCELGVGVLTAAINHVNSVVGATTLVAEDGSRELPQGIL